MMNITRNTELWLPNYLKHCLTRKAAVPSNSPIDIFISICDHYEPLWNHADKDTGLKRVQEWCAGYPKIAARHKGANGTLPKYTFFYPSEEYYPEAMDMLADLAHNGYGEVEVHLHHDNDTSENLRKTLIEFKEILSEKHGLLSKDRETGEIKYGFVHGNWALCNSRPDSRMCGVNDELDILKSTGCYADFTMPSAPDITQTSKINSIYYAEIGTNAPKAHNRGTDAEYGKNDNEGLLMVQGPLTLNWKNRKYGVAPRIENSELSYKNPITPQRVKLWINANIHVKNSPDHIFIKLHTHGCQEKNSEYLLNGGLADLFFYFNNNYNDGTNYRTHFVTAREMVNVVKALEDGVVDNVKKMREYRLVRNKEWSMVDSQ